MTIARFRAFEAELASLKADVSSGGQIYSLPPTDALLNVLRSTGRSHSPTEVVNLLHAAGCDHDRVVVTAALSRWTTLPDVRICAHPHFESLTSRVESAPCIGKSKTLSTDQLRNPLRRCRMRREMFVDGHPAEVAPREHDGLSLVEFRRSVDGTECGEDLVGEDRRVVVQQYHLRVR